MSTINSTTLQLIDTWCEDVIKSIFFPDVHGKLPSMKNEKDTSGNEHTKRKQLHNRHNWPKSVAQLSAIACEIQALLLANEHSTLRDIFYRRPKLFKQQKESNHCIAFFTRQFRVPRWKLHIVSTSRGLIRGAMAFDLLGYNNADVNSIDCNSMIDVWGVPLPSFVEKIGNIILHPNLRFVLVLEKETIFSRLGPCVIITSKGYPDIPTRVLLSKLYNTLKLSNREIPFFLACDLDPSGISIGLSYITKPLNEEWFFPENTLYPNYTFMAVTPEDAIVHYKVDSKEFRSLTLRDKQMLINIIQRLNSPETLLGSFIDNKYSNAMIENQQGVCLSKSSQTVQTLVNICQSLLQSNKKFELDAIKELVFFFSSFT